MNVATAIIISLKGFIYDINLTQNTRWCYVYSVDVDYAVVCNDCMAHKIYSNNEKSQKEQLSKKFGLILATKRKAAGLTQEQLADKADFHRTYIGFIEQGVYSPNLYTLRKIAQALDIKTSDLIRSLD